MSQTRQSESDLLVRSLAVTYAAGYALDAHAHEWDQLVYAVDGVMSVHTGDGSWVVPSRRAVWVPAGIRHHVEMSGHVSMRTLYFRPGLATALPRHCTVV